MVAFSDSRREQRHAQPDRPVAYGGHRTVCRPNDAHRLEPEVAEHDPQHALFGGPDGMAVIGAVVSLAARLLRPGGAFAVEHDDTTSGETVELIARTGLFEDITARTDLAGRPRFVTARRQESATS